MTNQARARFKTYKPRDAAGWRYRACGSPQTNDEKARVPFETVVSVPCFELWLLLHFEDVLAPLHRDESLLRLQVHLPGYAKGQSGHWAATQDRRAAATARASALAAAGHNPHDGQAPFTDMHSLIDRLLHLKEQAP